VDAFVSSREGDAIYTSYLSAPAKARKLPASRRARTIRFGRRDGQYGSPFPVTSIPSAAQTRRLQQEDRRALEQGKMQAHMADSLLYRHWTD